MKFRRITFIFQEPLTEDHKGYLNVNFLELRNGAVKAMRDHLFNRANRQFKERLTMMANIAEAGITYGFPKPNEAEFIYPIMDLTGQSVTIGGNTYHLGSLMPEKKIIHFIIHDVSKDMGVDGSTITYIVEDYDKPVEP